MQKWEYCVLGNIDEGLEPVRGHLYKLTNEGAELAADINTIRKGLPKGSRREEKDVVAQIIAQLGEEGWEMVGAGITGGSSHALYFKRPKP